MCHNASSKGVTKDVDHGPEPIADREERRGGHLHIATKALKPSTSCLRDSQNPVDGHN